jgi:hypothetical protein
VLSGWLLAQSSAIPGTASMRSHAAEAMAQIEVDLGADRATVAQARGAAFSTAEVVSLLLSLVDHASAAPLDRTAVTWTDPTR